MSRKSNRRKRDRKRRQHQQQRKLALQLPVLRKVSTADFFAEIEHRAAALAENFEGRS